MYIYYYLYIIYYIYILLLFLLLFFYIILFNSYIHDYILQFFFSNNKKSQNLFKYVNLLKVTYERIKKKK